MMDKLRNWMNNNSPVVTVLAVVCLIGAIAFMVKRKVRTVGAPGMAWYFDTVSNEYFTDATTRVPPFKRDNGNEAVRAHFFTCGECTATTKEAGGERFIGYFEKYTEEIRARLEESPDNMMMIDMTFTGRLYSRDGKEWVPAEEPAGTAITASLQEKCPPKMLRYCPPE